MVVENPTWGAPRIHGELLMLGFDLCERTISRWMKRVPRYPEPAKRWLAFLGIAVEDEKPRSQLKRKRFSQLLHDPQGSRMLGDVNMQDEPPIMMDDEEAIEHTKGDRWHGEEVHGRNRFPMVSKGTGRRFQWPFAAGKKTMAVATIAPVIAPM
jgi:hypothetical protein